jgi:fumarate reductase flavoprotein subunit
MDSSKNENGTRLEAALVILGGGGAGLSAALEAAEKGAGNIIVVEKRSSLGGNSALAGGIFGCESPVQARENVKADKDDLFKKAVDWAHWSEIDPAILRAFINKSGDTIRWLEEKGLEFKLISLFPDQDPPVQHNPKGHGARLIQVLAEKCRDLGVTFLLRSSAKRIMRDRSGVVAGVLISGDTGEIEIGTSRVIIATGGFGGNPELLKKYFPSHYYDGMPSSGLPLEGDGLFLAVEAGAAIEETATMIKEGPRLDPHTWPLMFFERDPCTVWVNKDGKRFIDESFGYRVFESVNAMLRQPDKVSFALFDRTLRKTFEEKMPDLEEALWKEADKGRVKISDSWDDMAGWIGADPGVLKDTIEQYNLFCKQGYDKEFAKNGQYLLALDRAPYYAIKGMVFLLDTIGGIRINEHMQALDDRNEPIPGLYAAGVVTSGWESETYCSELSASAFGFAVNSGRIAGENAVCVDGVSP